MSSYYVDRAKKGKAVEEGKKKPHVHHQQNGFTAKGQAQEKFDVYPPSHANAWAAKMYKQHRGGWR